MNYITEINGFWDSAAINPLSTGQVALWFALMHINNKCGWQEWFTVPNQVLSIHTGLSRGGILKARNILKQQGYLVFKEQGTKATKYRFNRILDNAVIANSVQDGVRNSVQDSVQDGVQNSVPLNKLKQNTNKTIPPNSPKKELFDRFWNAYPRKTAKQNARKAWDKLDLSETLLAELLAALDWQRKSEDWTKENGKFIPHAATWLNGRRWEDERSAAHAATTDNRFSGLGERF